MNHRIQNTSKQAKKKKKIRNRLIQWMKVPFVSVQQAVLLSQQHRLVTQCDSNAIAVKKVFPRQVGMAEQLLALLGENGNQ
jgi:hypothetical protein